MKAVVLCVFFLFAGYSTSYLVNTQAELQRGGALKVDPTRPRSPCGTNRFYSDKRTPYVERNRSKLPTLREVH